MPSQMKVLKVLRGCLNALVHLLRVRAVTDTRGPFASCCAAYDTRDRSRPFAGRQALLVCSL